MPRKLKSNYFNFSGGLNTDSSVLNRDPITVTDINNCLLNLDASIESRYGFEILSNDLQEVEFLAVVPPGTIQEPVVQAYNWEFINTSGSKVQYQVVRVGETILLYQGNGALLNTTPSQTFSSAVSSTLTYKTVDIVFEGDKFFVPTDTSFDIYVYSGGTVSLYSSSDMSFRSGLTISGTGVTKEVNNYVTNSAQISGLHPYHSGQTIWTSGAATGNESEFDFDAVYAVNSNVSVTKGVLLIPDSVPTDSLYVGNAIKIVLDTEEVVFDTINEIYNNGSGSYRIILENLSEIDGGIDYVQFKNPSTISVTPYGMDASLGRLFVMSSLGVYFSQIYTDDLDNIYKMYQAANPFDPDDPSIVASDGGFFSVKGAETYIHIQEMAGSIIIFCSNGVWEATGIDGFFTADNFVIRQITSKGCVSKASVSRVESGLVYLSEDGINLISKDESGLFSKVASLTDGKIQDYITSIPKDNKAGIKSRYNPNRKEIYFLHNTEDITSDLIDPTSSVHFRKILVFSLKFGAWFILSLSDDIDWDKLSISDVFMTDYNESDKNIIIDSSGNTVVTSSGGIVIEGSFVLELNTSVPMFVYSLYNTSGITTNVQYGRVYTINEKDFEDTDYEESNLAYFSAAHQTYSDILKGKQSNYMKIIHEKTETGEKDIHGRYVNQGGCKVRCSIDFADSPLTRLDSFGQFSNENVAYGKYYNIYPEFRENTSLIGYEFDGLSHLQYKHKLLGRGNVLQYSFKNFIDKRWFKAKQSSTDISPILDTSSTYWEEITEAEHTGSEWSQSTTYSTNDTVSVFKNTKFKIIGWSCELVPTEGVTTS